jgi:hypothetical protein
MRIEVMYGRLVRVDRIIGSVVDMFRTFVRRLIVVFPVVLACFACVFLPRSVLSEGTNPTYATQYAACEAAVNSLVAQNPVFYSDPLCESQPGGGCEMVGYVTGNGFVSSVWSEAYLCGSQPNNSTGCSAAPTAAEWVTGKVLDQYFTDQTVTDSSGNVYQCRMELNPATPPMQCGDGSWCTYVEMSPASSSVDPNPVPDGQVDNSSGAAAQPAVPNFAAAASSDANQTAPNVCGTGSCYDPNTGTACAIVGGSQLCETFPTSPSQNACTSNAAGSLCAGMPTAPSPSPANGSPITNPVGEISSGDNYVTANPSTGVSQTTGVDVYTTPGTTTSSGSSSGSVSTGTGTKTGTGSSAPASGSSSGGSDSYGDGTDCNTPPVCSGDAVMCGIAQQDWTSMCFQDNLLVGNGQQPPTFASDQTKYSQSNVWVQPSTGNTEGDQANQGTYNQSGFGYSRSCPLTDMRLSSVAVTIPFSNGCSVLGYVGAIILAFALYGAAKITAGSVME